MDRKWWTLIAVCVGTFMLLLDVTIVNVALPSIQTSLKASFSDLQWVVDAYSLTLAALLLTTGSLADLWGRRLIFVVGLVVFSGSSLASGLAQSPLWLNLARGAQGVGAAAMFSTGLALLGSSFQGRERGVAFGVWGAITGLAVAIGPVIGGGLTTGLSWRWIFLVNVPIGVAAVVISLLRVEESKMAHARRPDPIGVLTFSGALAALVYALIKGNQKGWTTPVILGCLIGAGVLLILFLIAEWLQRDRAMFDLSLFRKPTFTGGAIAAFGLSGGLFALFLYLTLYLQDVLGYSALQTGLRFIVLSGGMLLTSALAGRLTAVVPIRFLIAPGLLMVAVGLFLMRGITAGTEWTHLIPGFIVAGAGTGLINPPLASTAIGVVRPERAGMASGINSTFRQVGIATGIAGLGAIFSHQVRTTIESMLAGSSRIQPAQAHALASSVASGNGARSGIQAIPAAARGTAVHVLKAGFASGLNEIFLIGAILSLASAALTLVLIRSKDFEVGAARTVGRPDESATSAGDAGAATPPPSEGQPAESGAGGPADPPPAGAPAHPAQDATLQKPGSETAREDRGDQPDEVAVGVTPSSEREMRWRNGSHLQVDGVAADTPGNEHPGREVTKVSDEAAGAEGASSFSSDAEHPALHRRMSGYGLHSPLPPPPPPPALATPAPGLQGEAGRGSSSSDPSGPPPRRYPGWQSPSEAWKAASQAWRTMSEPGQRPAGPAQSPPERGQSPSETRSPTEFEPPRPAVAQASWGVRQNPPAVQRAEVAVEQGEPAGDDTRWELEQAPMDALMDVQETSPDVEESRPVTGEASAQPSAGRTDAIPAARSFWSRFSSGGATNQPSSSASPEADAVPPAAESLVPEEEAPAPEPPMADAGIALPEPEPGLAAEPEAGLAVEPEPGLPSEQALAEPLAQPEPVAEPEPIIPDPDPSLQGAEAEMASPEAGASEPAREVPATAGPPPPSAPDVHGPARRSDLPSGQDVSMSTPSPGLGTTPSAGAGSTPQPSFEASTTRDVRLVVQAVQSAEEAALAYAREIGEARRHLAAAIQHLDMAEEARLLLNRYAAHFGAQPSSGPGQGTSSDAGVQAGRGSGGPFPGAEHAAGPVHTPSPGIAIANPSGSIMGPRGSAAGEEASTPGAESAGGGAPESSAAAGGADHPRPYSGHDGATLNGADEAGGYSTSGGGYGSGPKSPVSSGPTPPVPPPPRPGGWGPVGGGSQ